MRAETERNLEPLHWRDYLAMIEDEPVRAMLAPVCQRLDALMGARTRPRQRGDGEPDGVDGLTRRGSYDRLLTSEWALAEASPLEFLRRAGSQEHTFFSLARQAEEGAHHVMVLFDAGPTQLGAPRLVHLALVVVLAARAKQMKATFSFKTLQDRNAPLVDVDASALSRLLRSRSSRVVAADDVARALVDLDAAAAGERVQRWLVGAPSLSRLFSTHEDQLRANPSLPLPPLTSTDDHAVTVEEKLALDQAPAFDVAVMQRGQPRRSIRLPRPERDIVRRLLRDPFRARRAAVVAATTRIDPAGGLVFSPSGRRLLAKTRAGHVMAFGVPNSSRQKPGKPKEVRVEGDGQFAIAAGFVRRRPFAVTWDPSQREVRFVGLEGVTPHAKLPVAAEDWGFPADPRELAAAYVIPAMSGAPPYVVLPTPDGDLIAIDLQAGATQAVKTVLSGVLAMSHNGQVCCIASREESSIAVSTVGETARKTPHQLVTFACSAPPPFEGMVTIGGSSKAHYRTNLLTVLEPNHPPRFVGVKGGPPFHPSEGADGDGAVSVGGILPMQWSTPSTLKLDLQRQQFLAHDGTGSVRSPRLEAPVCKAVISPVAAVVGYITVKGDVGAYSFDDSALLLDVRDVDQQ